jgi:hypothetical protein
MFKRFIALFLAVAIVFSSFFCTVSIENVNAMSAVLNPSTVNFLVEISDDILRFLGTVPFVIDVLNLPQVDQSEIRQGIDLAKLADPVNIWWKNITSDSLHRRELLENVLSGLDPDDLKVAESLENRKKEALRLGDNNFKIDRSNPAEEKFMRKITIKTRDFAESKKIIAIDSLHNLNLGFSINSTTKEVSFSESDAFIWGLVPVCSQRKYFLCTKSGAFPNFNYVYFRSLTPIISSAGVLKNADNSWFEGYLYDKNTKSFNHMMTSKSFTLSPNTFDANRVKDVLSNLAQNAMPTAIPFPSDAVAFPTDRSKDNVIDLNKEKVVTGAIVPIDTTVTDPTVTDPTVTDPIVDKDYTGFFSGIVDWLKKIYDAIISIAHALTNFFVVDMSKVAASVDFSSKFRAKFKLFYDLTDAFANIDVGALTDTPPFFTMPLPEFLGGGTVVILDFRDFVELFAWGRIVIRCILWVSVGMFLLKKFDVNFNIA